MPKGRITVIEDRCKSCGLCVAACPKSVLRISDRINDKGYRPAEQFAEGCIACRMCALTCPDVAIEVFRIDEHAR
jgi:2-oxoglutarate ferredoxin oxidoreductase subunit delta